jgi:hypothetical protein
MKLPFSADEKLKTNILAYIIVGLLTASGTYYASSKSYSAQVMNSLAAQVVELRKEVAIIKKESDLYRKALIEMSLSKLDSDILLKGLKSEDVYYTAFIESMPWSGWISCKAKDNTFRFLAVNKIFEKSYSIPKIEILGKNVFELFPDHLNLAKQYEKSNNTVANTGKPIEKIIEIPNVYGDLISSKETKFSMISLNEKICVGSLTN